jgi:methylthioribose-1-phosphate isomerase
LADKDADLTPSPKAVAWHGDAHTGRLELIDQTLLPGELKVLVIESAEAAWEAIKQLRVRGAPAIGIAAAFGMVVGVRDRLRAASASSVGDRSAMANEVAGYLKTSRPTAVNLFWALDRMLRAAARLSDAPADSYLAGLLAEAEAIRTEDEAMCVAIGKAGAELLPIGGGVLTHCNTGALATADFGTALSAIIHAHLAGRNIHVWVDETRPLLQGARLTAWELQQRGVPATLICDNMAGMLMRQGKVQAAIVGADRIAANGDAANKIGTYSVAVLCRHHGIPFYVAAPSSTFDLSLADGSGIPIEERTSAEITHGFGRRTAPEGVAVYNPAFDVTPGALIAGFVTEKGVIRAPYVENLRLAFG